MIRFACLFLNSTMVWAPVSMCRATFVTQRAHYSVRDPGLLPSVATKQKESRNQSQLYHKCNSYIQTFSCTCWNCHTDAFYSVLKPFQSMHKTLMYETAYQHRAAYFIKWLSLHFALSLPQTSSCLLWYLSPTVFPSTSLWAFPHWPIFTFC